MPRPLLTKKPSTTPITCPERGAQALFARLLWSCVEDLVWPTKNTSLEDVFTARKFLLDFKHHPVAELVLNLSPDKIEYLATHPTPQQLGQCFRAGEFHGAEQFFQQGVSQ